MKSTKIIRRAARATRIQMDKQGRAAIFMSTPVPNIVHITYSFSSPTNVINTFENWLNEICNETEGIIHTRFCVLCWSVWSCRNNLVLNKTEIFSLFARYLYDHTMDSDAVLSPMKSEWAYGLWIQMSTDVVSWYLSAELAGGILVDCMMHSWCALDTFVAWFMCQPQPYAILSL
jgi:hypothetical protein